MKYQQLRRELKAEGASDAEAGQLIHIATGLRALKSHQVSMPKKRDWSLLTRPLPYLAAGIALGMFLVMASQAVLPTSWLYPVQAMSDGVAVHFHPEYRSTVMMKRAQQVNELVNAHANSRVVLATLGDYTRVAGAYKLMPHTNYSAFEFCESNLRQASLHASPTVRQALANSLHSLHDA